MIDEHKIDIIIDNFVKNENAIKKLAGHYNTSIAVIKNGLKELEKRSISYDNINNTLSNSLNKSYTKQISNIDKVMAKAKQQEKQEEMAARRMRSNIDKAKQQLLRQREQLLRQQEIQEKINEKIRKNLAKFGIKEQENMKRMKISNQGFFKTMKMSLPEWQKFNKEGGKFNTLGGHIANSFRKATHGLKGFKMEMLGIMFFGMSIYRTFNGLLKTSMEWLGVTEIFSEALGILFLPVAELLLKWALLFLDWVLQLTPKQKKLIGLFVLFGAAIGAVIMVIGMLALGIGSMIMAFSWLLSPLGLVIAGFAALAGYFVLKQLFSENANALDKLKEKMEAFGVSGEVFDKVTEKIREWYNIAKEYLFGDEKTGRVGLVDKIKQKLIDFSESEDLKTVGGTIMKKVVEGAKKFFEDNPTVLIGAIVGGLAAGPLGASIGAAIGLGFDKIDFDKISSLIDSGMEILQEVINGMVNNLDKLEDVVTEITENLMKFVEENIDDFLKIGVAIAEGIMNGIKNYFKNKFGGWKEKTRNKLGIEPGSAVDVFLWGPELPPSTPTTNLGGGSNQPYMSIAPTYNVNVSDKSEFERMLELNNNDLVFQIQRGVKT